MPVVRHASHRASRPVSRQVPLQTPPSGSAARPVTRQASEETRLADQLIRWGCLWEEHAHYIRVKEKTEEGLSSAYTHAMDRWVNDPEFSRRAGPTNYLEGRDGYVEWIEEVIRTYCKPTAEITIEDHCIVTFAAFSAYNFIYCNEPCLQDLDVIGRIHPVITRRLADCARDYQDSEPDFFNHPVLRKWRKSSAQQQPMSRPSIGDGVALVGASFEYKTRGMRRARTCVVTGVLTSTDGVEYIVKYPTAKDPDGERAKKVMLSEDEFRKMWDARSE